jgi:hypothetical protein
MILLSRTYQQSARRRPEIDELDPENQWLARMNLRRLDAEAIRDAIISVVGARNDTIGGPSVPVTENLEGKVVIGKTTRRDGLRTGVDGSGADDTRRSVFIEVQRKLPLNMLATFDQPEMNPNCDLRRPTTVATQSLWFMNDGMVVEQSDRLARMLLGDFSSDQARLDETFLRLFAALPTADERAGCLAFLAAQREHFSKDDPDAAQHDECQLRALSALCQTLFASNRFLYVD